MLDPINTRNRTDNTDPVKEKGALGESAKAGEGEGYRFNFFGKGKKSDKKNETKKKQSQNTEPVVLQLSEEAKKILEEKKQSDSMPSDDD